MKAPRKRRQEALLSPANVAIDKPATSSSQVVVRDYVPAAVRTIARIPTGPNSETLLIAVDTAESNQNGVALDFSSATAPLLEAFVAAFGLGDALQAIDGLALRAFGTGLRVRRSLETAADLGGDFVKVDVQVLGMDRENFRALREVFDLSLEELPDRPGVERVVVTASRSV